MQIIPFADGYLCIRGLDRRVRISMSSRLQALGEFDEVVPGLDDLTVQYNALRMTSEDAEHIVKSAFSDDTSDFNVSVEHVVLPVQYGGECGPDLKIIADALRLTEDKIVSLHANAEFVVDLMGFTPGFAYMSGLPNILALDRLAHPRQQLAAGSVGIAAGQCGLYALDGPGGWPIIGRVLTPLFDAKAEPPFMLKAGTRVTFDPVNT